MEKGHACFSYCTHSFGPIYLFVIITPSSNILYDCYYCYWIFLLLFTHSFLSFLLLLLHTRADTHTHTHTISSSCHIFVPLTEWVVRSCSFIDHNQLCERILCVVMRVAKRINWALAHHILRRKSPRVNFSNPMYERARVWVSEQANERLMRVYTFVQMQNHSHHPTHSSNACMRTLSLYTFDYIVIRYVSKKVLLCAGFFWRWSSRQWFVFIILEYIRSNTNIVWIHLHLKCQTLMNISFKWATKTCTV